MFRMNPVNLLSKSMAATLAFMTKQVAASADWEGDAALGLAIALGAAAIVGGTIYACIQARGANPADRYVQMDELRVSVADAQQTQTTQQNGNATVVHAMTAGAHR